MEKDIYQDKAMITEEIYLLKKMEKITVNEDFYDAISNSIRKSKDACMDYKQLGTILPII